MSSFMGGSDMNNDTPYYLKEPFSNDNSKTVRDILSINHIFTGYKRLQKEGLYSSIFEIFNTGCPEDLNKKLKFVCAFNLMYIENN